MREIKTREELKETVNRLIRRRDFDVDISVEVANLKRAAGQYHHSDKKIRISKHLLENHPEKAMRTIKHELGHAVADQRHGTRVKPHGREWKAVMAEMNVENPSACHSMQLTEYNYIVKCSNPDCDVEFGRYRKSKKVKRANDYICGKCGHRWESFEVQ